MTKEQVSEVLRSLSLPNFMNAYGFPIGYAPGRPLDTWGDIFVRGEYRVERGSGIGGRGDTWRIVNVQTGESGPACKTSRQLHRELREWLAGPKPPFPGNWYPRRNRRAMNDAYIWVKR
jgi:hypothetical protein